MSSHKTTAGTADFFEGTYWVTMIDKFMSGWGRSDQRTNVLIFECDSLEEAEIVSANASNRSDMKHVTIHGTRPSQASYKVMKLGEVETRHHFIQYKTKAQYPNWYKPNYFKGE